MSSGTLVKKSQANREAAYDSNSLDCRALFSSMNEGVAVHELLRDKNGMPSDYRILAVNPAYERIIGLPSDSVLHKSAREAYLVDKAPFLDRYAQVVDSGQPSSFDAFFPPMNKHFRINAFRFKPNVFATVFSDITDQISAKLSLEKVVAERNVLLKELYHRTKNNLQLVSGLIVLEMDRVEDEKHKQALTALERKIQGIASVHRRLYESATLERIDLKGYLEELAPSVVSAILSGERSVQVKIECVHLEAGVDAAVAIGLIVNELLHNAVKHAVPGGAKNVCVTLERRGADIRLSISDDGPGLPSDFADRRLNSTGLELAETLVRERLNGSLEFISRSGLVCRAVFPSTALC